MTNTAISLECVVAFSISLPASEPDREDWTNIPPPREKITIERVSFWVLINSLNIELPYRNNFACVEHLINIDTLIDFIMGPLLKAIAYQNTRSLAGTTKPFHAGFFTGTCVCMSSVDKGGSDIVLAVFMCKIFSRSMAAEYFSIQNHLPPSLSNIKWLTPWYMSVSGSS